MLRVGIAGIGFMGMVHYLSYQKVSGVKVVGLCETNKRRLSGDWTDIKGNFGPAGEQMDLSGIAAYENLDQLFADSEVDLVDICLPPAFHVDATIGALAAGKHVFCEKPMALDVSGTERMEAAAEKAGKQLMIGHVLPLFPEFEFAHRLSTSGQYGRLLGGHFKRVISDPQWLPNFYDPSAIGGPMLDLHVHDAHFIRLLFGMPTSVDTQGRMRGEVVEYFNSQFQFDDPRLVVSATSGVVNQQGRAFLHGYEIHFEKATLVFEFGVFQDEAKVLMPCTIIPHEGPNVEPELGSGDPMVAFEAELTAVINAVESGDAPAFLRSELARDAICICHRQTESAASRRRVSI